MELYKVSLSDAKTIYNKLGCDKSGSIILSKKSSLHFIYIKNMHVGAANILKQDALSIGADLAVPSGVIVAKDKYVDGILIANSKHLETLSKKELAQPFGLKDLAKNLSKFTKNKKFDTRIMGVLNANEDSFFSNSRFSASSANTKIETMINDGADIIDIGGVSSRPGSIAVSAEVELERVKDIIDTIYAQKYYEKALFSLDSYQPIVLDYALNHGFKIVNDITGLANPEVAKVASKYDASVVIMHMQKDPTIMQNEPSYENVILEIDEFFTQRINLAKEYGIKDIILDVGIGFGKNLSHNLELLSNLEHFKHFGYELLIGASRKSMLNMITPSSIEERLPGTLALHLDSIRRGASIIRCHDVKEHFQAIKVQNAILSHQIL